jgi:hypothetical protein
MFLFNNNKSYLFFLNKIILTVGRKRKKSFQEIFSVKNILPRKDIHINLSKVIKI